MKPPVDAPTSSARRPSTSTPSASSAFASLTPPRDTYGAGRATSSSTSAATSWPGFSARRRPGPRCTSPASTAAAARERDGNSPRSASRESSRTRAIGAETLPSATLDDISVVWTLISSRGYAAATRPRGSSTADWIRSAIRSAV